MEKTQKKSPEKSSEKSSEKSQEKIQEKVPKKSPEKSSEKPSEKFPEKSPEKSPRLLIPILLCTVVFLAIVVFVAVRVISSAGEGGSVAKFSLDSEFYNSSDQSVEIVEEDFARAVSEKRSFVLYVSLPHCTEDTALFKQYVNEYQEKQQITFYYMTADRAKKTSVNDTIKYYPSVLLYEKGELKKYLDFESDSDLEYYKSLDGFAKWFETYVNLKEN